MRFDATEFLDDLSSDPVGSVASAVADSATAGGGCRPESSEPIRASERENTPERPSRLPCVERGAVGRTLGGGQSTTAIAADRLDDDTVDLPLDAVDRAVLDGLADGRNVGPIVADPVLAEPTTVAGVRVPAGWSRDHWIAELRRMASRCEQLHPARAADLRADADKLTEVIGKL